MREMFEGCALLVNPTGAASATPATITLGVQFNKALVGFFGYRATGSGAYDYILASSVSVHLQVSGNKTGGPQTAADLMQCPSEGASKFTGKVYLADKDLIDNVWVRKGYVDCISYDEQTVNALIGDFGSAFGKTTAYGYVGASGDNSTHDNSVVWRIRTTDAGVGTLLISPNKRSGYNATTYPAVMRDFGYNNESYPGAFAPWTGKGMAGGDGDGYSKSFRDVKVLGGVTAGMRLDHMFYQCSVVNAHSRDRKSVV